MTFEDAKEEIKLRWRDFLEIKLDHAKQRVNGEISYICPICGHGKNGDGLTYNPDSKEKTSLKCFGCSFSGDDIDLYARMTNRDTHDKEQFKEIVAEMAKMLGIDIDDDSQNDHRQTKAAAPDKSIAEDEKALKTENTASEDDVNKNAVKFWQFINQAASDLYKPEGKAALDYLHERGFIDDIIKNFKIGYSAKDIYFNGASSILPAVITPHLTETFYYSVRSLQGKYFWKPKEADAGKQPLFNPAALYSGKPCFICESIFDAMSIVQSGGNAAALAGVGWRDVLMSQIEKQLPEGVLILSLDNDQNGQKAQGELADALEEKNIPFIQAKYSLDQYAGIKKDANDLLRDNPDQLKKDVERISKEAVKALQPDNIKDYILSTMPEEIESLRHDAQRKTGFVNLDYQLHSLYSGLYICGGISSVGKTTFLNALCDSLAEQGEHVLFFSLEQSRLEMVSKSISRQTALIDKRKAVSSDLIRMGLKNEIVEKATENYVRKVGNRISIVEGDFNCNVQAIHDYTERYIKHNNVKPTLIVDYLQILDAIPDKQGRKATDSRIITDQNVTGLKRISREFKIPVIVISSLNRTNYLTPIDYESFKESGGIEYGADVLLGLELACMTEEMFTDDSQKVKKRERVAEAKAAVPRKITLVCLKNRYGRSNFNCNFLYYPQFDYFEVPPEEVPKKKEEDDYFRPLTEGEQQTLPFK